jgi:hypothetical protein
MALAGLYIFTMGMTPSCNDQDLRLFAGLLQDELADTQSKAFRLKVGKRR